MSLDGADPVRLTDNEADDGYVSWSPDGDRLAFMSDRDGNSEIYTMRLDGSDPRRLTHHEAVDSEPSFSPPSPQQPAARSAALVSVAELLAEASDAARRAAIVFHSERDGNREIYVMGADGSAQTRLTYHPATDGSPVWSPDGSSTLHAPRII